VLTPPSILKFKLVSGMSRFQEIVDKLAGIEQFLLGKKLYLAAGVFRQLYDGQLPSAKADGLPIPITGWVSGLVDFSPLPKPFGSDSIVSSARRRMLKAALRSACKVKPQ
jgi:hypothetical protein